MPETVGPMAGATEITTVTLPMTTPRRSTGTSVRIVVISSGSIIAVPLAWTTRAGSSSQKAGDTAASRVPELNRIIAVTNTWRVVRRCSR